MPRGATGLQVLRDPEKSGKPEVKPFPPATSLPDLLLTLKGPSSIFLEQTKGINLELGDSELVIGRPRKTLRAGPGIW